METISRALCDTLGLKYELHLKIWESLHMRTRIMEEFGRLLRENKIEHNDPFICNFRSYTYAYTYIYDIFIEPFENIKELIPTKKCNNNTFNYSGSISVSISCSLHKEIDFFMWEPSYGFFR